MINSVPNLQLNNGVTIPQLGLGVWQAQDGAEVEEAVKSAISVGYRLIDTAAVYDNETGVGAGIRASGINRGELFVTTKVWNADQGYDSTLRAFEASLKRLDMDYVDLYLIHWPMPARGLYNETWKAMETLYEQGLVKAIGVCNFQPAYLQDLMEHATVMPAVNQIELHPYFSQKEVREYCRDNNIIVESWSPIGGVGGGGGRTNVQTPLLQQPILKAIGARYDKSPAQVVIRWHIQNGFVVIPKSVHPERIKENISVFDFELTSDDMLAIDKLHTGIRGGGDPDTMNS